MTAAIALLGLSASACGGGESASSRGDVAKATLPQIELKDDPDRDADVYPGEPDNEDELFGRPAPPGEAREIAALVKRYYAAAAGGDGAAACRLVYSPTAESLPEEYPSLVAASHTGSGCAAVLSRLFAQMHRQLHADSVALKVAAVRVHLNRGAVQLDLERGSRARYTVVRREGGAWKMLMLFDRERPIYVE